MLKIWVIIFQLNWKTRFRVGRNNIFFLFTGGVWTFVSFELWRNAEKSCSFISDLERYSSSFLWIIYYKQVFIITERVGIFLSFTSFLFFFFPFFLFLFLSFSILILCLSKALKASQCSQIIQCISGGEKKKLNQSFLVKNIRILCSSYDLTTVKCDIFLLYISPNLSCSVAVSGVSILYWRLLWSIIFHICFHWILI